MPKARRGFFVTSAPAGDNKKQDILMKTCLVSLVALASALALAVGPTGTLYAMNYGEFAAGAEVGLDRIQGASFASSSTGNSLDICIAAYGDVRTTGYSQTFSGSRFDLSGNPLAGGPYMNTSWDQLHDGTSDGKYNYSVDYVSGNVYQFDRNWANATVLFNPTGAMTTGFITMNAADGSFWLSEYGGPDIVRHYTHTGTLLSSFNSGVANTAGLALDPLDGTLWMSAFDGGHSLYQFDQSGNLLQSMSFNLPGTWYGMEFDTTPTPEPMTMLAVGIGCASLLRRRKP